MVRAWFSLFLFRTAGHYSGIMYAAFFFIFLHVLLLGSVFPSGVGFHPLYIICPSFPFGSVMACFSLFFLPCVSFCPVIFFRHNYLYSIDFIDIFRYNIVVLRKYGVTGSAYSLPVSRLLGEQYQ